MIQNYYNKKYSDGFFNVSSKYGFLPVSDPLKVLPEKYTELQLLIDNLHIFQENDKKGILAIPNEIEKAVSVVPDYSNIITEEDDVFVLQALFRAYTFITSGYTLELAYQEFIKNGNYGVARQLLPQNISKPLVLVSKKLDVYPWLDYHYAYSLGNYVKKNETDGLHWQNLDMACKFTGTKDEIGFIMLHVYINELSPLLVNSVMDFGKNIDNNIDNNIVNLNENLKLCGNTMEIMNKRRREMWVASRHENYNDFRIFIMGIKGNDSIFGKGLVYEDCFDNEPQQFRGQTGAQDNIIPMIDIFSGIVDYYPENDLTKYLLDLRGYRPKCIQDFFVDLRNYYEHNPILKTLESTGNITGLIYLLKIVDEVYLFRNGHWQFVQKYIMSNTKYAFATGGTPITTWLINQIECVLEYERIIIHAINFLNKSKNVFGINNELSYILTEESTSKNTIELFNSLEEGYNRKKKLLLEQINELKTVNYDIDIVYMKNDELNLNDKNL
jgi:indoleamine 2,3-dioxygenase